MKTLGTTKQAASASVACVFAFSNGFAGVSAHAQGPFFTAGWATTTPVVVSEGETARLEILVKSRRNVDTADFPTGSISVVVNSYGCDSNQHLPEDCAQSSEDYVALSQVVTLSLDDWTRVDYTDAGNSVFHYEQRHPIELETKTPDEQDRTADKEKSLSKDDLRLEVVNMVLARGPGASITVSPNKVEVHIRDVPWAKVAWSLYGNLGDCWRIVGEDDDFHIGVLEAFIDEALAPGHEGTGVYRLALVREEADLSNTGTVTDGKCNTDDMLLTSDEDVTIVVRAVPPEGEANRKKLAAGVNGLPEDEIDEFLDYYVAKKDVDFTYEQTVLFLNNGDSYRDMDEVPVPINDDLNEILEFVAVEIVSAELPSHTTNRHIRGIRTVTENIAGFHIRDEEADNHDVAVGFAHDYTAVVQGVETDMHFTVTATSTPVFPLELIFDVVRQPNENASCVEVLDVNSDIGVEPRPRDHDLVWVTGEGEEDFEFMTGIEPTTPVKARESKIVVHPDDLRHLMRARTTLSPMEQFCLRLKNVGAYLNSDEQTDFSPDSKPVGGTDPIYHQILATNRVAVRMSVADHGSGRLSLQEPYRHDEEESTSRNFSVTARHAGLDTVNDNLTVLDDYPYEAGPDGLRMEVAKEFPAGNAANDADLTLPDSLTIAEGASTATSTLKVHADRTIEKFEEFTFGIEAHESAPEYVLVDSAASEQEVRIVSPERALLYFVDPDTRRAFADPDDAHYLVTEGHRTDVELKFLGVPDEKYFRDKLVPVYISEGLTRDEAVTKAANQAACYTYLRDYEGDGSVYPADLGFPFEVSLNMLEPDRGSKCTDSGNRDIHDTNGAACPIDIIQNGRGRRGSEHRIPSGISDGDTIRLGITGRPDNLEELGCRMSVEKDGATHECPHGVEPGFEDADMVLERLPGVNSFTVMPFEKGPDCDTPSVGQKFELRVEDSNFETLVLEVMPYHVGRIIGNWSPDEGVGHEYYRVLFRDWSHRSCLTRLWVEDASHQDGGEWHTVRVDDPRLENPGDCPWKSVPVVDAENGDYNLCTKADADARRCSLLTEPTFDTDDPDGPFPQGDVEYNIHPGTEYEMKVESVNASDMTIRSSNIAAITTHQLEHIRKPDVVVEPGVEKITLEWPWPYGESPCAVGDGGKGYCQGDQFYVEYRHDSIPYNRWLSMRQVESQHGFRWYRQREGPKNELIGATGPIRESEVNVEVGTTTTMVLRPTRKATITGLTKNEKYWFRIRPYYDGTKPDRNSVSHWGDASSQISAVPFAPEPDELTNLRASRGDGLLNLTWDWDDTKRADGFHIEYRRQGGETWQRIDLTDGTLSGYDLTGLANGVRYEVRVRSTLDGNHSEWAEVVEFPVGNDPTISLVGNYAADEGDNHRIEATLRLSHLHDKEVSVRMRAVPGTAVSGDDYNFFSDNVVFRVRPGTTEIANRHVGTATIRTDGVQEPDRWLELEIHDAKNASIGRARATVVIIGDETNALELSAKGERNVTEGLDHTATITLTDADGNKLNSEGDPIIAPVDIPLSLSAAPADDCSTSVAAPTCPVEATDYHATASATIKAGKSSARIVFRTRNSGYQVELDESVDLTVSHQLAELPQSIESLADAGYRVTIRDNDVVEMKIRSVIYESEEGDAPKSRGGNLRLAVRMESANAETGCLIGFPVHAWMCSTDHTAKLDIIGDTSHRCYFERWDHEDDDPDVPNPPDPYVSPSHPDGPPIAELVTFEACKSVTHIDWASTEDSLVERQTEQFYVAIHPHHDSPAGLRVNSRSRIDIVDDDTTTLRFSDAVNGKAEYSSDEGGSLSVPFEIDPNAVEFRFSFGVAHSGLTRNKDTDGNGDPTDPGAHEFNMILPSGSSGSSNVEMDPLVTSGSLELEFGEVATTTKLTLTLDGSLLRFQDSIRTPSMKAVITVKNVDGSMDSPGGDARPGGPARPSLAKHPGDREPDFLRPGMQGRGGMPTWVTPSRGEPEETKHTEPGEPGPENTRQPEPPTLSGSGTWVFCPTGTEYIGSIEQVDGDWVLVDNHPEKGQCCISDDRLWFADSLEDDIQYHADWTPYIGDSVRWKLLTESCDVRIKEHPAFRTEVPENHCDYGGHAGGLAMRHAYGEMRWLDDDPGTLEADPDWLTDRFGSERVKLNVDACTMDRYRHLIDAGRTCRYEVYSATPLADRNPDTRWLGRVLNCE